MKKQVHHDPDNYAKMSVPHESPKLANEALQNFYEDVTAARKKHKIANVLIVTKDAIRYPNGQIGEFFQHSQLGDSLNTVPMAAYAYGQTQAEHREIINKLIAGKQ